MTLTFQGHVIDVTSYHLTIRFSCAISYLLFQSSSVRVRPNILENRHDTFCHFRLFIMVLSYKHAFYLAYLVMAYRLDTIYATDDRRHTDATRSVSATVNTVGRLTRSQAVARIADRTAHFQGKLFVRPLGTPETKLRCVPNLKSVAQVVFEILRSKRIGVTSLTFQGHVTSSLT